MRQIFVDSRDRSAGSSTDFSIVLPQTLSLDSSHQARIDDLRLPNAIPTISVVNNGVHVKMGADYYYLTLQNGQVNSGPDLANVLRAQLISVPGNWNVSYDTSQMTLSISCNNPFEFVGGTFVKQLLNRPHGRPDDNTYLFLYVPLQGLDQCYLCCQQFSHMDNVGPKHASDVICSIPITVGYGAVQHYSMSSSVFFDVPAITTQQLSFQLRDRDWNIVNSFANISFTLTID
jgi:hypothetical protein